MEDENLGPQGTTEPSSSTSPIERKPSADEDPAAMTIEFLRARLLSERSVSKAARQRAQLLAKKVAELEERLEAEIQFRKKLEADRLEILLKYRAELSDEYSDFFTSNAGEDFPKDESAPESLHSRKNDTWNETSNQDDEGMSSNRLGQLERSDSSPQLNFEDANDEDAETDQSLREKGVLSWGRRKGSRREFSYSTDWLGRSLSQRSLTSADGESPQKRWAGKSVRQFRKRDQRRFEPSFEEENRQIQVCDDSGGKIGQPSDTRDPLPCEDERDTEVERVLEQQAELIEQYEAEENAQRAWEAKFKEGKALFDDTNVISPSNSTHDKENLLNQSEPTQKLPLPDVAASFPIIDQTRISISEGLQLPEESTEALKTSEMLQDDFSEQSKERPVQPTTDVGKKGRYNPRMSSSFTFAVFADADEQATDSSPQMQGFARYKQDASKEGTSELSAGASGQVSTSGSSDAVHPDFPNHDMPAASLDVHSGANYVSGGHDTTRKNTESQEKARDLSDDGIPGMEKLSSCMAFENGVTGSSPNVNSASNMESSSFKEELNRGMKGLGEAQDMQQSMGRPLIDSQSHVEPKGPGSSEYLQSHHSDLSHPDYDVQPPRDVDGATFGNLAVYPGYSSAIHGPPVHSTAYEGYALRSHRRSTDAFDRVTDVLRALQIAKLQILCAKEEDAPGSDGNDDDVREAFYVEPPRPPPVYATRDAFYAEVPRPDPPSFPPVYGAGPPPYATSVPYSSRGPPYVHNMHGWGASGYGIGSSRQVPSTPYMHYPSRYPEAHNLWLPPPSSHGLYNGKLYQYDTRQRR